MRMKEIKMVKCSECGSMERVSKIKTPEGKSISKNLCFNCRRRILYRRSIINQIRRENKEMMDIKPIQTCKDCYFYYTDTPRSAIRRHWCILERLHKINPDTDICQRFVKEAP